MSNLLPAWPLFATFLVASFVLAIMPGPGVIYILSRSLSQGLPSGMASVVGVAIGNLANAFAASLGLAALFSASFIAFSIAKFLGAAYLINLGIRTIRHRHDASTPDTPSVPLRAVFRDGAVVALFNPKTALFFAAFLPQFIRPDHAVLAQSLLLGMCFVLIAATTDSAYALAATSISMMLGGRHQSYRRIGGWLAGSTYVGLGVAAALTGGRSAK